MAAAWSLSRFPDRYDVTVLEAGTEPGGVACTFPLGDASVPVNYGVQGGAQPNCHWLTLGIAIDPSAEVLEQINLVVDH